MRSRRAGEREAGTCRGAGGAEVCGDWGGDCACGRDAPGRGETAGAEDQAEGGDFSPAGAEDGAGVCGVVAGSRKLKWWRMALVLSLEE